MDKKKDRGKVYTLRWELHMKEKQELINMEFLVEVLHLKGGVINLN